MTIPLPYSPVPPQRLLLRVTPPNLKGRFARRRGRDSCPTRTAPPFQCGKGGKAHLRGLRPLKNPLLLRALQSPVAIANVMFYSAAQVKTLVQARFAKLSMLQRSYPCQVAACNPQLKPTARNCAIGLRLAAGVILKRGLPLLSALSPLSRIRKGAPRGERRSKLEITNIKNPKWNGKTRRRTTDDECRSAGRGIR
jgi:hypothetical protein